VVVVVERVQAAAAAVLVIMEVVEVVLAEGREAQLAGVLEGVVVETQALEVLEDLVEEQEAIIRDSVRKEDLAQDPLVLHLIVEGAAAEMPPEQEQERVLGRPSLSTMAAH
jgi:hypothetical protein